MSENKNKHIPFNAPLRDGDTEEVTVGCRANNPDICKNNGIPGVCAFERADGICRMPSKAWKKQYQKLKAEGKNDAE